MKTALVTLVIGDLFQKVWDITRPTFEAYAAKIGAELKILGNEIPDHLKAAGDLRITHKQASLEELGALSDPPLTKDAIAGRIRRLLAMADKRANELGIPTTEASLTPEMLEG
jgi:hypothetical protein